MYVSVTEDARFRSSAAMLWAVVGVWVLMFLDGTLESWMGLSGVGAAGFSATACTAKHGRERERFRDWTCGCRNLVGACLESVLNRGFHMERRSTCRDWRNLCLKVLKHTVQGVLEDMSIGSREVLGRWNSNGGGGQLE